MTGAPDFFQPDGQKLILAVTLIVPALFVVLLVTGFSLKDPVVPVAIAIAAACTAACIIDRLVRSRTIKIAVAAVAAILSIILGYILVRSMTIVCDPVHDPGHIVCDPVHTPGPATAAPTVIAPVRPTATTPMIFDPVHQPGSSGAGYGILSGTTTGIVAEKPDECKKMCER